MITEIKLLKIFQRIMAYLVRRINRSKWDVFDYLNEDDAPADAMTLCLKTFNNELSTWLIDDLEDLNKAILALITGSKQENLSTIHIVYFDQKIIAEKALSLKNTDGDTVIGAYKKNHWDIDELTYSSLGKVKDIIIDCLRNDRFKILTKATLKELLNNSIKNGILEKSNLNKKLQENL
ncbi:hypothetical protein D3C85_127490 [compost metagenome]